MLRLVMGASWLVLMMVVLCLLDSMFCCIWFTWRSVVLLGWWVYYGGWVFRVFLIWCLGLMFGLNWCGCAWCVFGV